MATFGENFQRYLEEDFDESRLNQASDSLLEFLEPSDILGRSFLDAGCGSGLFSLAAARLGASRIVSFDIDARCVECCRGLVLDGVSDRRVLQGSVLDRAFVSGLGRFDVVYCWGVAHHSGDMWSALDVVSTAVADGGALYLGVYNHADGLAWHPDGRVGSSGFWKRVKAFYARLPRPLQSGAELLAMAGIMLVHLLSFKDPFERLRAVEGRGMTWRQSLRDWLLGHPYEYARPEEVFAFMKARGFQLSGLRTNNGLLTNHFVFRRGPASPAAAGQRSSRDL